MTTAVETLNVPHQPPQEVIQAFHTIKSQYGEETAKKLFAEVFAVWRDGYVRAACALATHILAETQECLDELTKREQVRSSLVDVAKMYGLDRIPHA